MEESMDDESHEGRCTCGEVRYRMNSAPMIVHACHCTECQRLSGGPFAINALVETSHIDLLSGEPVPVPVQGTSGKAQTIMRCPKCQVAVWSHYPGAGPRIAFVRVGTLDQPGRLPPDIHIYTSTRLPWLELPPGAKAVDEYYSPMEVWSAESRSRFKSAREAQSGL
jgi:hypothetical protein